ncbi:MAG: ABC transporter ATP-binding protein [Dermatophilaceae bacterium]
MTSLLTIVRARLRPYRGMIAALLVLQLAGTVASLYLPSLNGRIIDEGVAAGDTGFILAAGAAMLGVSLVQIAATVGATRLGAATAAGVGRDLRAAVFRRVGGFSARELAGFGAPTLISRSTNDVTQVQQVLYMSLSMLVSAPIAMIGGIAMALREDPGLAWLVAVAVPALGVTVGVAVARMVPYFRRMQTSVDSVNRILREQITGIRVVRAFVREEVERERFGEANSTYTATALAVGRLQALVFPLVMVVFNASTVAVLWFGAQRVESGAMQVGQLTAFMAYLIQILMSVMTATFVSMMVPRASVSAGRIEEVLVTESSVRPPAPDDARTLPPGPLTVELREATFAYPGARSPVLREVSFAARPGSVTAIVGSTGAGKTTLVGLVPRLHDVTGGAVLVGGVDVRQSDPRSLGSRIGLVPQRPYLFTGTVASNLRLGDPDATDDELWHALRVAQAEEFVRAMPQGLDAPISQGGTNVSGGQRQRLAIARALVRRADIYLFDDAFSALDVATDARLRAALRPITRDATVLVVAQRVSTIRDADLVVVLEDGAVVGTGTHDELLAGCPTYREIVESQLQAEEAA